MQALTNVDLIKMSKRYKCLNLSGIYFKDDLPDQLIDDSYYIVNLQSINATGDGTHWVVFYYNSRHSLYYDSFGFMCPAEVVVKIKPYSYSRRTIQSMDSSACGYYCMAFIIMTMGIQDKKRAYAAFVNLFNNCTAMNERILEEILSNVSTR
jgi:hypothetical protein